MAGGTENWEMVPQFIPYSKQVEEINAIQIQLSLLCFVFIMVLHYLYLYHLEQVLYYVVF